MPGGCRPVEFHTYLLKQLMTVRMMGPRKSHLNLKKATGDFFARGWYGPTVCNFPIPTFCFGFRARIHPGAWCQQKLAPSHMLARAFVLCETQAVGTSLGR